MTDTAPHDTSQPLDDGSTTAPRDAQWCVYIVRCHDGSLYTGVSTDVQRRLREHNGELTGGARYTRPRRPVVLVYSESCGSRQQACRLESSIKSLNRAAKLKLIRSDTRPEVAR